MIDLVADGPGGLTPDWLTEALHSAGHRLSVRSVRASSIGTGQMARTFRLELDYDGDAGPPTLVAKVACEDPEIRRRVGAGYAAEVGFYQHLRPGLDVRTPGCWYAAISADRSRFALLLDDLSDAHPGVQVDGCSPSQAASAIDNLVGLHAPLWGDDRLAGYDFLLQPGPDRTALTGRLSVKAADAYLRQYGDRLSATERTTLADAARAVAPWMAAERPPFGLLHGDYRLDNLLFAADGTAVAVDWQTAACGQPLRDVSYFLGTCLEPGDRRANEERLLQRYYAALSATVVDYSAEQCWRDYRLGALQGPVVALIGWMYATDATNAYAEQMFLAMVRRTCGAIRDLGTLELI